MKMNDTQVSNLLKIGIRSIYLKKLDFFVQLSNVLNKIETYILIPTDEGQWIRDFAKKISSKWEGSYLSFVYSADYDAYTLFVEAGLVEEWKEVAEKIALALQAKVYTRGD